jgi:hypothetical protein
MEFKVAEFVKTPLGYSIRETSEFARIPLRVFWLNSCESSSGEQASANQAPANRHNHFNRAPTAASICPSAEAT